MTLTILRLLTILGVVWTGLASAATAQQSKSPLASLVADKITLNDRSQLVAEGNVYVIYEGRIIRAKQIIYDQTTDNLTIEGPIHLEDGDNIIIVASSAELGSDLQNGLLQSAQMVLAEQLQMTASRIQRLSGRYTEMDNTTASSCQICTTEGVPLWQIRAQRLVHDTKTKQLYFTGAQFRVGGVPVLYLPRLRMPDPTLKRAAGFLLPRGKSNTLVGYGIKLPYFIPFDDHKDLTLTPYLSSKTKTMEFRYRQMFQNGDIEMKGALTSDSLGNNQARGYIFGDGYFDLKREYKLKFNLETALDEAYLSDYTVSTKDRLASSVSISRARKHEFFSVEAVNYDSLRPIEDNNSLPRFILDIRKDQRWFPQRVGGETRLSIEGHSHIRASKADIFGRDVTRINGDLSWRRRWTVANGIRAGVIGQIDLDAFSVAQDSEHTNTVASLIPETAFDLRWPLKKSSERPAMIFSSRCCNLVGVPDLPPIFGSMKVR
jgi:LPS-assembly protein